jgi:hypothetical protein
VSALLAIDNLGKRFGGFVALESVSLVRSTAPPRINAPGLASPAPFSCRGRSPASA